MRFSSSSGRRRRKRSKAAVQKKKSPVSSYKNSSRKHKALSAVSNAWEYTKQWMRENRFKTFLIVLGILLALVAMIAVPIIGFGNVAHGIAAAFHWLTSSMTGLITLASISSMVIGAGCLIAAFLYRKELSLLVPVLLGFLIGSALFFGGAASLIALGVLGAAKYGALVTTAVQALVKATPGTVHWFTHTTPGIITAIAIGGTVALLTIMTVLGLWRYSRKCTKQRRKIRKRRGTERKKKEITTVKGEKADDVTASIQSKNNGNLSRASAARRGDTLVAPLHPVTSNSSAKAHLPTDIQDLDLIAQRKVMPTTSTSKQIGTKVVRKKSKRQRSQSIAGTGNTPKKKSRSVIKKFGSAIRNKFSTKKRESSKSRRSQSMTLPLSQSRSAAEGADRKLPPVNVSQYQGHPAGQATSAVDQLPQISRHHGSQDPSLATSVNEGYRQ